MTWLRSPEDCSDATRSSRRPTPLRLVRAYGTRATSLLGGAKSLSDLGRQFGATLSEIEVRYLMDNEWARTAEDVVWRRSKLGLRLSREQIGALDDWMRQNVPQQALVVDSA